MDAWIRFAESWGDFYAIHTVETSLFILVVWAVDHWTHLDTRLRYSLWLFALIKVFVPPFYTLSLPASLLSVSEPVATSAVVQPIFLPVETIDPKTFFFPSQDIPFVFWAFVAWACLVGVGFLFVLARNCVFAHALSRSTRIRLPEGLVDLKGATTLQYFVKDQMISPLITGVFRPRLYLPVGWKNWTTAQLRGVVAHELAHYHNRDLWALSFQVLATVLFGLNPLIWLVNRRLTYLRELRCDEDALKQSGISGVEYGRLLYDFLEKRRFAGLSLLGFNIDQFQIKKRFEYVLNFNAATQSRLRWHYVIPVLIAVSIVPFSIRKTYSETRPAVAGHELLLENIDIWPGLEKLDVRVITNSDLNLTYLKERESQIRQITETFFKNIFQTKYVPQINYRGYANILRDEINLSLGRQWVTGIDFGTEVSKEVGLSPGFGLDVAFDYGSVDTNPVPIHIETPDYPNEARMQRIMGDVEMLFRVNTNGRADRIKQIKGKQIFERAAIEAVKKMKF